MSPKTVRQDLSGVAETLLITFYIRAIESERPKIYRFELGGVSGGGI